ncbi:zinc finger protein 354A [Culex quinquefasciatus]|uniref:zinc finger protein 354A n=1 Tax=Culex quinquefasciatus TaxID=7176 RepID=UPI0018E3C68C|nr:zinc finger protein 354A [Culex quinquefasciatus]
MSNISASSTSSAQAAPSNKIPNQPAPPNSIVLEQNGEKRILKKIKLLKGPPKFRAKPPEPAKKVEPPAVAAKKMFVCTFCQSRFDCHGKLRVHFLKHGSTQVTGKNPERSALVLIECEWCPETFTTMSKAIEHKYRKHNYEAKNYFCKLCGRLFPLRVALEQHQALEHKGETVEEDPRQDFSCGFCGTAFSAQDALELHVRTAHNLEKRMMAHPFVPTPSKKVRLNQAGEIISIYYCHLCGSEYMLKFNLLKHIEDHHPYEERCAIPEDLLKCSTCDSMFCTKKAFDAHNVHHKPEDLYVTSEEHRLNIVARVDQDFDFRRVPTAMDRALGSTTATAGGGTDSAATLAKKHRAKAKKRKSASATATATATTVLDLMAGSGAAQGEPSPALEALKMLLGE